MVLIVKNCLPMQKIHEMWIQSLGQEAPLEEEMQPTPVFLSGKFHGQRSLVGYSLRGLIKLDMTEHSGRDRSMNLPVLIFPY